MLRDEGSSADGGNGDGVYGTLVSNTLSGPYSVNMVISGFASTGEPFERFLSGAFVVPGEPDSPGQVGEEVGGEQDQVTKFCGGPIWCCWLWIAFLIALVVTLVLIWRILCYFMKEGWWTRSTELIALLLAFALTVSLGWFLITYCTIALCWLLLTLTLAVIISGLIACFTKLVPCMGWTR